MRNLVISPLDRSADVEIVERKGLGHPDTICDALAENLSRGLCREYLRRFGTVLHHNVDKALLCGGEARPAFGGGSVVRPIRIFLAGRAVSKAGGDVVPIEEIAIEGSRAWLAENLHALDPVRHVEIDCMVGQGSQDLQALFSRTGAEGVPLANDTSFGVGHAPLSALEQLVLAIDRRLHGRDRSSERRGWGEDVKIMAVRNGGQIRLSLACAMVGRFLSGFEDYLAEKVALAELARGCAADHGFTGGEVLVNAADDLASKSIYLTVTGTSAEAGDDGEVGRGNRVNGLITPLRPMSLEAAAGKNPVSHVGKIYNVLAMRVADALVGGIPEVNSAECILVSRIGAPVSRPALVDIRLATADGIPPQQFSRAVEDIVADHLGRIRELSDDLIAGKLSVF